MIIWPVATGTACVPISNGNSKCLVGNAAGRAEPRMKRSEQVPRRAWQRMLSGRRLDLLNPAPADVEIVDIAHGLARVARWNGQTSGAHAFSVAQHCVLVESIAGQMRPGLEVSWRLAALLHDAPEYVVGDLISPFKAALGLDYKSFENRLQAAIHVRFGLPELLPDETKALIKSADRRAAYWEATRLAGFTIDEASLYFNDPEGDDREGVGPKGLIEPWPTDRAQCAFLERFEQLQSG